MWKERPLEPIRTVDVVILGRVQGVGYRDWTIGQAERRGLSGHVRNRADGSVAATFSGPPDAVAAMLDACRRGPDSARVDAVEVTETAEPPPAGFRLRRT
ncbi:acylphosphatase [Methylobacterium sp. 77]|uniref:acylphosphatase n=1 Tax=Methylobacterium sp. 77 TaxID=1101192 RepID=UPI0003656006|nr:acylphosphatase [Methylobacterium sp. 77]